MLHKNRGGFTLVELLVVVVIIGMLVALLVPAVNAARESARQGRCMNNVRELLTGLVSFSTSSGYFPGHTNPSGGWVVVILEQLGQKDLWEQCRGGGGTPAVMLKAAVCPNDDAFDADTNPDVLSYAVNDAICIDRTGGVPGISPTDLSNTTKTVLLGENVDAGKWHDDPGKVFTWGGQVKDCLSSDHPNVCIIGFCDMHAQKVTNQTDCSDFYGVPAP